MKISAVLIVKNEEAMLARCLDSIKGKVDEIVICDTGSTDKTLDIAKSYTENIQHFEWCDDFAKARNYAKQFASNEVILSIDADEVLKGDPRIYEEDFNGMMVTLSNEDGDNDSQAIRVFKKKFDWVGKIHEYVDVKDNVVSSDLTIVFGRSPTHDVDIQRNLRILANEYKSGNREARLLYYFGRELLQFNLRNEAKEAFLEYLPKSQYLAEKADALLMLGCLEAKENPSEAVSYCLNSIGINPDFSSPYLLIAEITKDERWKTHADVCKNTQVLATYDFEFIKLLSDLQK